MKKETFVIGVDGGGTKTIAALAGESGDILKTVKSGPSSPRNVGPAAAANNILSCLKKLEKDNVKVAYIGLASVEEQPKYKNQIRQELREKLPAFLKKSKIIIASDQKVAFFSGTDQKQGLVVIAGTGCVAHGWKGEKEAKASGWGWLNDEGSAFYAGQKAIRAVFKELDGRGPKTKITQIAFKELKIKNSQEAMNKLYADPLKTTPLFSIFCDKASREKDKIAKQIMAEAGKELALSAKIVIKKLGLKSKEFPVVLVGSMFKSPFTLKTFEKEIKQIYSKARIIRPEKEAVWGAINLAREKL